MYIPTITKEDEKQIRKSNAKRTANVIIENLEGLDISDLITNLYIKVDDEVSKQLVKMYEGQLILAMTDPNKFVANLNTFYNNTAKYLKKNKLYDKFLLFYYYTYKQKFRGSINIQDKIQVAYMSLLLEQFPYLSTYKDRFIGISKNNKPLYIKEPYLYLDYPEYKLRMNKIKSLNDYMSLINKIGYNVKTMEDIQALFMNYRLISNMLTNISFLIDETTLDLVPTKYPMIVYGLNIPFIDSKIDLSEFIMDRRRLLKNNKITVELDFKDIIKVDIKETFVNDELFLLFKLTLFDGNELSGFYDIVNDLFYSVFTDSVNKEALDFIQSIETLIKEIYLIQTADLDINKTHYNEFNMKFIHHIENTEKASISNKKYVRNGDYVEEIISLSAYTRRLPEGAKASDTAIAEAKKYGINLNSNETFVKPFQKNIYKLKK